MDRPSWFKNLTKAWPYLLWLKALRRKICVTVGAALHCFRWNVLIHRWIPQNESLWIWISYMLKFSLLYISNLSEPFWWRYQWFLYQNKISSVKLANKVPYHTPGTIPRLIGCLWYMLLWVLKHTGCFITVLCLSLQLPISSVFIYQQMSLHIEYSEPQVSLFY